MHDKRVVIAGGGFGGLTAAKQFGKKGITTTVIDRRNFHLFQPLLYQVATGFLAAGDIAVPIRSVLAKYPSVSVLQDELIDIDPQASTIRVLHKTIPYDFLILATGVTPYYFGHDAWEADAHSLKDIDDALLIRATIFAAFERAEREHRSKGVIFAIVGGGPTGVELAGTIRELAESTLHGEFRNFNPRDTRVLLFEGGEKILSSFKASSSDYARTALTDFGVEVFTQSQVTSVQSNIVNVAINGVTNRFEVDAIIWAVGIRASPVGNILKERASAELDPSGRIKVRADLSLPTYPNIFVVGDLAHVQGEGKELLPGLAPVAVQEGKFVTRMVEDHIRGQRSSSAHFTYFNHGTMAVIKRGSAVAEIGRLKFHGQIAWLLWAFIHIYYLIGFDNKIVVFVHWAWNCLTNTRSSRLITPEKKHTASVR